MSDTEISNYKHLDAVLVHLCQAVVDGQHSEKDFGLVAACVMDPDHRIALGINSPGPNGHRRHAERAALDNYHKKYGAVPDGSIIVTTLSPCNEYGTEMANSRYGESCTDLINASNIKKVYCGYKDPSQHDQQRAFSEVETSNLALRKICKSIADEFLEPDAPDFIGMMSDFLPMATKIIGIDLLPKIKLVKEIPPENGQPTFGYYDADANEMVLGIANRHPLDIIRTLSHELTHFRQDHQGNLNYGDGETGSTQENEANAVAGVVMREFGRAFPKYYKSKPVMAESAEPIKIDSSVRAKSWIEKVYAKYPAVWENNHVMIWGEGDDQQLAFFELIPSMTKKDAVEIKWFQAYPMRQGVGTRAMQELQALAREDGIALTLFPWQHGQVSQAKLMKFYRAQGFKPTVKGAKNMAWTAVAESLVSNNIKYHSELNPVAWTNRDLKPQVQKQLLKTALFFTRNLDIPNFKVLDVVLTGSMANYNYTKFSDFDVHVITNYSDLACDDLVEKFYSAKKKIWNSEHDITIHGHEVEMYVEDAASPAVSNAVYSLLKGTWIKEPMQEDPVIDDAAVTAKTRDLIKQIDVVLQSADEPEDIIRIVHKLKQMRQSGLDQHGEFGVENLSFKILRNLGYIEKLHQSYLARQDQELSIQEQGVAENFADGKNPQDKGDSKRHGVNTKASVSSLRKTAKQGGRKGQLAHWLANMKAGRAKAKK